MLKARGSFLAKPFLSKQEECTKLGIGTEVRPKKFGYTRIIILEGILPRGCLAKLAEFISHNKGIAAKILAELL